MEFNEAEKIVDSGRKKPFKTILILFILFLGIAIFAYTQGFFGEKGKEHAGAPTARNNQPCPCSPV